MNDFFNYLTSGVADKQWGIYLTVVGRYHAYPDQQYPSRKHPSGYFFDWDNGRVLDEYQLNYITEGAGIMQTSSGEFPVEAGALLYIQPGTKHRYKPHQGTGWTENYVGFNGKLAAHFMNQAFKDLDSPVIQIGHQVEILDAFQKINDLVVEQKPSYHQVASGLILKIMGYLCGHQKSQNIGNAEVDQLVNKAKAFLWENVNQQVDFQLFCKECNISYSYFRKAFKLYTGLAPHQYFLDLKIMRAKELVVATDKSMKAITYELGFDSVHYFSRLFKQKAGIAPTDMRKQKSIPED